MSKNTNKVNSPKKEGKIIIYERLEEVMRWNDIKTQKELSVFLDIKEATITAWKKGQAPNKSNLLRIAELLNCNPDYLTGDSKQPYKMNNKGHFVKGNIEKSFTEVFKEGQINRANNYYNEIKPIIDIIKNRGFDIKITEDGIFLNIPKEKEHLIPYHEEWIIDERGMFLDAQLFDYMIEQLNSILDLFDSILLNTYKSNLAFSLAFSPSVFSNDSKERLISQRLKQLRTNFEKSYSIEELSKITNIPSDRIAKIESKENIMTKEEAELLGKALNISPDYLLGIKDNIESYYPPSKEELNNIVDSYLDSLDLHK